MTNREVYEEAAGMGLEDSFFWMNGIDPDAECKEAENIKENTEYEQRN